MKITQLMFSLAELLAECEIKLLQVQKEFGVARLCTNLSGSLYSMAYLNADSTDAVALGMANAICPLNYTGLGSSVILDGLKGAGLTEHHASLLKLFKEVRICLVADRMSAGNGLLLQQTMQSIHNHLADRASDDALKALGSLVDQVAAGLANASKTQSVEHQVKLLLGLGVCPESILSTLINAK